MIEVFSQVEMFYQRRIGAYGINNYSLMAEFKELLRQNGLFNQDSVLFGIALDDPNQISQDNCRYDVGFKTANRNILPDLPRRYLDDGAYLIVEVEHTAAGVEEFWNHFAQHIFPYKRDETRPILERYPVQKVKQGLCEFCLPIVV